MNKHPLALEEKDCESPLYNWQPPSSVHKVDPGGFRPQSVNSKPLELVLATLKTN